MPPSSKPDDMRVAHWSVTLNEVKGLSERFFAALSMTVLSGGLVKCPTKQMGQNLLAVQCRHRL
jgi:hypothetical protein